MLTETNSTVEYCNNSRRCRRIRESGMAEVCDSRFSSTCRHVWVEQYEEDLRYPDAVIEELFDFCESEKHLLGSTWKENLRLSL